MLVVPAVFLEAIVVDYATGKTDPDEAKVVPHVNYAILYRAEMATPRGYQPASTASFGHRRR